MDYFNRRFLAICAALASAIFILLFFLYFGSGAEKPKYNFEPEGRRITQPQTKQFEPNLLSWTLATSSAEWQPRDSAVSFVFQDKIWTMGGLNGNEEIEPNHTVLYWEAPHFNDIWTTENGSTWQIAKEKADWPPRRSMSVVYFNGKLWMFGGWSPITGYESDIWQSDDGINWIKAVSKAAWPAREGQTAEIFQGKIWMMGGVNYDEHETKNDVWYSDNGIDWREATTTIPWSSRWDHATAVFKEKIFLIGGMNLSGQTFKDVWSSSDGLNWELVSAEPSWLKRQGHSLVVFHDKMWIIGRLNDAETGGANDIWYSDDGTNWQKTETDPPWIGREDHSVLVFKGKIFVFGGMDSDWKWRNDVWVSSEQNGLVQVAPTNQSSAIVNKKNVSELALSANSFVSVFATDNGREQVLFQKNKDKQLPLASITKLMTALVASGIYKQDDIISVSEKSLGVKGVSGIYKAGDRLLFSDALRALLIASHNEIADAMAEQAGKETFLDSMNERASMIGLSGTQFVNVVGLDPEAGSDSINHSTAFDVYKLAGYIQKNYPSIISITSRKQFDLSDANGNFMATISSTDKLLGQAEIPFRILGGKTGETPRAKQNLVVITESPCEGKLFSVVLDSQDSFGDMQKLLEYDRDAYEWKC
ncbi:MAG: serine hydrolase [Patescibacteria group bacterium]